MSQSSQTPHNTNTPNVNILGKIIVLFFGVITILGILGMVLSPTDADLLCDVFAICFLTGVICLIVSYLFGLLK